MKRQGSILSNIILLIAMLLLVTGFFLYLDANQLRKEFPTSHKIFIYEKDGTIITGIRGVFNESTPEYLDDARTSQINEYYKKKDYDSILKSNFKIFITDKEAFEKLKGEITFLENQIDMQSAIEMMESDDTILEIAKRLDLGEGSLDQKEKGLYKRFNTGSQSKGAILSLLLQEGIEEQGELFLVLNYKREKISIYPETITLKLIKLLPENTIRVIMR